MQGKTIANECGGTLPSTAGDPICLSLNAWQNLFFVSSQNLFPSRGSVHFKHRFRYFPTNYEKESYEKTFNEAGTCVPSTQLSPALQSLLSLLQNSQQPLPQLGAGAS